jgi:indole-3-glycerol phosphate synthase
MQFTTTQDPESAPRNILEEIVWWKATEVAAMRERRPLASVMAAAKGAPPPRDFIGALEAAASATGRPGLIAEVKKASPSKGVIQPDFDPVRIAKAYEAGGAACLSVLTDAKYFQGSFENLTLIRTAGVACPLLAKEFIVEAYQLFAARAAGADAVLLIAAVLPNADLDLFLRAARKVGLQCLVEVHTVGELTRVLRLDLAGAMLGINNRDLGTFVVDLKNTDAIMASPAGQEALARGLLVTGESGIFTPDDVAAVARAGCGAILVGESLVKQGDPCAGVKALLA